MKPTLALQALPVLLAAGQPTFFSGPPGVGKSTIIHNYAAENDLEMIDLRVVLLDPVDLRGLPYPVKTETPEASVTWLTPDFLPTSGKGILFLDELNAAPRLVQSACLQLVLDRKLGDYTLPDGWHIVAAGNRETDSAGVGSMITPLANRFTHIEIEVDLNDWTIWAFDNNVPAPLIAFLRFRPELLSQDVQQSGSNSFASPRSWAAVGTLLNLNPDSDIELDLFTGTVGEGPALELIAFLKMFRELPNLDAIVINPDTAMVPHEPAPLYATVTGLAAQATAHNFDAILKYAERLPEEFSVCLVKDCVNRNPQLANSHGFVQWAAVTQSSLT